MSVNLFSNLFPFTSKTLCFSHRPVIQSSAVCFWSRPVKRHDAEWWAYVARRSDRLGKASTWVFLMQNCS